MKSSWLLKNISELVTLEPLVNEKRFTRIKNSDLGRLTGAWLAVEDGKVAGYGANEIDESFKAFETLDAGGCLVLPGLIDAHTHPVFAGSRANEFCMRLDGRTYQEIAAAGGGIQATVTATKSASNEELESLLRKRLQTFLAHGVTTIEAKSGYGLSIEEELRHLRLLRMVGKSSPVTVYITCLALHAVPKSEPSAAAWAERCANELLPIIAKENLADAVDAFIEGGYFSVADCKPFFGKAKALGLDVRVHADEFTDAGAAPCAASYQALSADHLQFASPEGIAQMGKAGVTALLLPGTSLYTGIPYTNARPYIDANCPVGLATDFNPGSCVVDNLRLVLTLGALHCKLSAAEALAAVTWIPARSLRLNHRKGALTVGMDADILMMPMPSLEEFVADLGRTPPKAVYSQGIKR